jgi:hypothetical protein
MNVAWVKSSSGVFTPTPKAPEAPVVPEGQGWQPVETIPKDRRIEVIAPPHSSKGGHMFVEWVRGGWAWSPKRGGLAFPIYPVAWREI